MDNDSSLTAGELAEKFESAGEGLHIEGEFHNIMIAITKKERDKIVLALRAFAASTEEK